MDFFQSTKFISSYVDDKARSATTFVNYFLDRVLNTFEYKNLPKNLHRHELELQMLTSGLTFVTKHNDKWFSFNGQLGGERDVYYHPRKYIVSNPALNLFKEYNVYEADGSYCNDGVLFKNDDLTLGIMPIIQRYSYLLAENLITLRAADIMLRITSLISAPDDSTKNSADLYLNKLIKGELSIVGENQFFDGIKLQSPPSNNGSYLTQFIELHQYYLAQCYNELGLNAQYNMKRETLTESEIKANDDILQTLPVNMLKCRKRAVERLNELYDLDISVDYSSSWKENQLENNVASNMRKEDLKTKKLENEILKLKIDSSQLTTNDSEPLDTTTSTTNTSNDSEPLDTTTNTTNTSNDSEQNSTDTSTLSSQLESGNVTINEAEEVYIEVNQLEDENEKEENDDSQLDKEEDDDSQLDKKEDDEKK